MTHLEDGDGHRVVKGDYWWFQPPEVLGCYGGLFNPCRSDQAMYRARVDERDILPWEVPERRKTGPMSGEGVG